jgi:hypothetical protein
VLNCQECGLETEAAEGWLAFRVDIPDDPDTPEVIVFCPECSRRELGAAEPSDA